MQTLALLHDSWRLLLSRKLFWITFAINLLVVALYASIGFTEQGVSILFGAYEIEDPRFRLGAPLAEALYRGIFSDFIVTTWLAWIATGLALVSTTSIFPDFLADGAIDLVVSKPIGRAKVFLVKYLGALLFVLLQVSVFCLGAFLAYGWRLGEWNWAVFLAIPLVTLFYSYLYGFNVLMAMITRSSIAALIFTALFWLCLFFVQSGEGLFNRIATDQEVQLSRVEERLARREAVLAKLAAEGKTSENSNEFERVRGQVEADGKSAAELRETATSTREWHGLFLSVMTVLPKNQETIGLVGRALTGDDEPTMTDVFFAGPRDGLPPPPPPDAEPDRRRERRDVAQATAEKIEADYDSRSIAWIIGTSLLFEAALIGAAMVLFIRRDF